MHKKRFSCKSPIARFSQIPREQIEKSWNKKICKIIPVSLSARKAQGTWEQQQKHQKVSIRFRGHLFSVFTSIGNLFPSHLFLTKRKTIQFITMKLLFVCFVDVKGGKTWPNFHNQERKIFVYLLIDRLLKLIESRTCNLFASSLSRIVVVTRFGEIFHYDDTFFRPAWPHES